MLPLVSTLAGEIIPSLIKEHGEESCSHAAKTKASTNSLKLVSQCVHQPLAEISQRDLSYFVEKCSQAFLEMSSVELEVFAQNLFDQGLDIEVFYLDIIPQVARSLHYLWEKDIITFFDVTRSSWNMKRLISSLSPDFIKPDAAHMMPAVNRFQVLVATAPGAQHTLGPLLVSQYLQRKGWHLLPGFDHEEKELLALVSNNWIDLICISVSLTTEVPKLKSWVAKIKSKSKNVHIQCIVGGPLLALEPELVSLIGAHAASKTPRDAHTLGLKMVRVHRKLRKLHLLSAAELSGAVAVKNNDQEMGSKNSRSSKRILPKGFGQVKNKNTTKIEG